MSTRHDRSFAWLNVTQFFGALNDNVFRWLVIFFLLELPQNQGKTFIIPLVSFIFVLPFLLFSHAAGVMADRHSKRSIIVFSKWFELFIMALGTAGIYMQSTPILYMLVFFMCLQSTIFGPSKYGVVPELVKESELSRANGYLTGLTYLAIIIGTFIPTYILVEVLHNNFLAVAISCIGFSVAGLLASMRIRRTPPAGGKKTFCVGFIAEIFRTLIGLKKDRPLLLAVLGAVYFLFLGAFVQQNLVIYGIKKLGLSSMEGGYIFPAAAFGIGIGALLAGSFSRRNIEFGIVPIGAAILTVCCIAISCLNPVVPEGEISLGEFMASIKSVLFVTFVLGIGSGLFIVPLNAFIQYQSPKDRIGEILACTNFFSFIGVALSSGAVYLLDTVLDVSPNTGFLIGGILTAVLAVVATILLPDFLIRFVMLILTRCVYPIKVKGIENLPTDGPALIAPNHVTWVDALLLSATQQRRIRFLMSRSVYDKSFWIKPVLKLMRVIPIHTEDGPRALVEAFRQARQALDEGWMVCIFPEGGLTRNGNMQSFKPGIKKIIKGTGAPIIPAYIGGAWGSIFSYYSGKLFAWPPKKVPYPITIIYGKPMPDDSTTSEVRLAVQELGAEYFNQKKSRVRNLPYNFVRNSRRHWHYPAISDTTGKKLNFGKTLISSIALSRLLERKTRNQEKVGVLLPSCVAGALVNTALALLGKTSVNLNFTASQNGFDSAIRQCELKTIITSRAFMEKLDGPKPAEGAVYMEDLAKEITGSDKLIALLTSLFVPARHVAHGCSTCGPDDTATIIFSSGSTADPKGIMLSHHNIISNVEQISDLYHFGPEISICGILPLFHSFGFTVTLWCPMITGARVVYHPNPVDAPKIGEIIRENKIKMLFTTPTFLLVYIRKIKKEDLASLEIIMTGAEKLKPKVAQSFKKRFGIEPVEGYGTTELSPVAACNLPDVTFDGLTHVGNKPGTIGHPVPGIAVRINHPDTGEALHEGEEGMLMIKGPNVMTGYLDNPEKTAEALKDGWYDTGDMAKLDKDGFITIVGRMTRFSKIGGEMVPHIAIEDMLMQELGAMQPVVFVTAAEDEKKGEKLVILHTDDAGDAERINKIIQESDLPNLWKPRKDNIFRISEMPTLGSGKLDLKGLKDMAEKLVERKPGLGEKIINKIKETL